MANDPSSLLSFSDGDDDVEGELLNSNDNALDDNEAVETVAVVVGGNT